MTHAGADHRHARQGDRGALAHPAMQNKFADLGAEPMPMGPAELGKLLADDTEKWGKVIRAADIHLD